MVRLSRRSLPTVADIEAAEASLRKYIPVTPLEYSKGISELTGRETYLKLETFHPTRVFKIRGAINKLLSLSDAERSRGVCTASSGNHGFAISYAAKLFGVKACVCVPDNVNPQKLRAIEEQGAEVVRYGRGYDETYVNGVATAKKRNLTFIHAFDDPAIIAGQGTCGLEISRQLPDLSAAVVAIGGGGLISGIALYLKETVPGVRVYGAETSAIPSMYESIKVGRPVRVDPGTTIADGMQAAIPGELTFQACSRYLDKIGLVGDSDIEEAILDLLTIARVLAEPAGAAPLAAVKTSLRDEPGGKTVLVVSGGNISLGLLGRLLSQRATKSS